jgi:hypothetical protein
MGRRETRINFCNFSNLAKISIGGEINSLKRNQLLHDCGTAKTLAKVGNLKTYFPHS